MSPPMLSVSGLQIRFGGLVAINDMTFEVREGEVLSLIGPNGAGTVDAWVAAHRDEVERVRMTVHEIAGSGLTLSKLSVAASMLGDLAK